MITVKQKGDFSKTYKYLNKIKVLGVINLNKFGEQGVRALAAATPVNTGLTANSWNYEVVKTSKGYKISFYNSNIQNGVKVAIVLQYGHATKSGGWVQGRDYINPAIQPIFDRIAEEAWQEVKKA